MPVIVARIKLEWLGAGWQFRFRPLETDRTSLMSELVNELRSIVINAVDKTDNTRYRMDDTVLEVVPVHQMSENVPDLKIEVRVAELGGAEEARQERRWSIARDVSSALFHYLDQDKFLTAMKPAITVECLPVRSSGISRDSFGGMTGNWGVPDYSNA